MDIQLREKIDIIELDEVASTNLYAKANLSDLADRTVVCADKQTAGRGRFQRAWVDLGCGNIFMSIVLKPSSVFKPLYTNITQYLSVVLCQVMEEYGLTPEIKWPNDVQIKGKKIAGILSETVVQGQNFKGLILGAGINLNAKQEDLSLIKDKEVTALNLELGKNIDKMEFLNKLLDKFFENYDNFLSKGFSLIEKDYISRTCFLGKEISVKGFDKTVSGFAKCINSAGELVLSQDDKEILVTMGDIL